MPVAESTFGAQESTTTTDEQESWIEGVHYAINDVVTFEGQTYINLQATSGQESPADASHWEAVTNSEVLSAASPAGQTGLKWQGEYVAATSYITNDAVAYNGRSYINIQDTTGDQDPTDTNHWELLADKGEDGAPGLPGQNGVAGVNGKDGLDGVAGAIGLQGVAGIPGAQGDVGPVGLTGAAGATGVQGPVGATGAVGAQGPAGPIGPAGPVGAQGPTGAAGSDSINGIDGFDGLDGDDAADRTSDLCDLFQELSDLGTITLSVPCPWRITQRHVTSWRQRLKFLSKTWFNLDIVWALSLILVGLLGIYSAHVGHHT